MRPLPILLACLMLVAGGCGGSSGDSGGSADGGVTTAAATTTTSGGGTEAGDPQAGEIIWVTESCSNCHTLGGVAATSLIGPNLDETKPDVKTIVDVVTNGKGSMQSYTDSLSPQDIANVAAYIKANELP
jgi:mono/diheme cytochrome c family protein